MIKNIAIKWFWNRKIGRIKTFSNFEETKSILFLKQNENKVEILKNTALFRELKKRNPEIKIGVVLLKETEELLKNNPNVDKIYIYNKDKIRDIKYLAEELVKTEYDAVIEEKDLMKTLEKMGIDSKEADLACDVHIADHNFYRASAFKSFLKDKKMIIVYESEIQDELLEKIKKILTLENNSVIFLFPEEKRKAIEVKIKEIPGDTRFPIVEGFQDILALMSMADEVITSDLLLKEIADLGRRNCLEK